jgi:medium-chain acyl-[acyl-carrier-protein] hydrolase
MPEHAPRPRLICLPYAGGSAHIFQPWRQLLGNDIDVVAPVLPGRGARLLQDPLSRIEDLIAWLQCELGDALAGDYALWGHSMGAMLSYELARARVDQGLPQPRHLFVSGRLPPHRPRRRDQYHLAADDALIARLTSMGGMPPEVLANTELMEMLLPMLRADVAVCETYAWVPDRVPLRVPMTVMGGDRDPEVPLADLLAWRDCSQGEVRIIPMVGHHFFLHDQVHAIAEVLTRTLLPHGRGIEA